MSVLLPQPSEIFIVRTFKSHINNQNDKFTNVYEFQTGDPPIDQNGLRVLAETVVAFEKTMTTSDIIHDRVIISQWTPTGGYDPNDMMSITTGGVGSVSDYTTTLPLEAAMHIRREVPTGRQGKLLLRGSLKENQVESVAGDWILTDTAARETDLQARLVSSQLIDYMQDTPGFTTRMVMHGVTKSGAVFTRRVTGFSVAGVSWSKMTRRWYNRNPA